MDIKIHDPNIVSISAELNTQNIILVDKKNNFVIKYNLNDNSTSLLFVQKSSYFQIESGELLNKPFGPSNVKCFALIVSAAETWNFNLRDIYLYLLTSNNSIVSSLVFHRKILIRKSVLFDDFANTQLLELPSGNLLFSLTGTNELYKIFRFSNEHLNVDRPVKLKYNFQCMAICHVAEYFEYVVFALANRTFAVYRIEDEDDLIFVIHIPIQTNLLFDRISNLIWDPNNKFLISKYFGESLLDIWTLTHAGGLTRRNEPLTHQSETDALLEAKVFSFCLNRLIAFNSKKGQETLNIYQIS